MILKITPLITAQLREDQSFLRIPGEIGQFHDFQCNYSHFHTKTHGSRLGVAAGPTRSATRAGRVR